MNRIKYYALALAILFSGCISDFKANLPEGSEELLVVEGNILANSDVQFYFSKSFSINDSYLPEGYNQVNVALFVVGSDGYRSQPATYLGDGVHQVSIGELNDDVSYGIEFTYEGETYQSTLIKPVYTPPIDELSFIQTRDGGNVSIRVSTHSDSTEASYFMWQYKEDWEYSAKIYASILYDLNTREYVEYGNAPKYYCWSKDAGTEILVGSTEKLTENRIVNRVLYDRVPTGRMFSLLYSTRIKQRGISKGAYEYYLDQAKANQDMGGLFSPQPSGIEGNVKCITESGRKVIGYVDVSRSVVEDTLFISSSQISGNVYYLACGELANDSAHRLMAKNEMTEHQFIESGYHPVISTLVPKMVIEYWVRTHCIDCTQNLGTKNKPVFWPNNHE